MKNYIDQLMQLTGGKSSGGSRARRGKGKNKYNAQKTGGYDSKKEYRRACLLKALLRSGEISDLREQVKYVLILPNAILTATLSKRNAPTMLISSIEIKTAIWWWKIPKGCEHRNTG